MAGGRRCVGTVGNDKSDRFGKQCSAFAVAGSEYCNMHRPDHAEDLTNRCVHRKKSGEQCRNPAVPGATICRKHGVNKFILAKAQKRLASFADPALTTLYDLMIKPSTPDNERGRYALAIIDRVGLGPSARFEFEVEAKPWEVVMSHVVRELPADYTPALPATPYIDAEVIEDEPVVNAEPDPRDTLTRIIPPKSSNERATYVKPARSSEPPEYLR